MKKFAELYDALDSTNKTNAKVRLLQDYFAQASHEDIIWALYFFSGRRPRRQISSKQIRDWLGELSGLPLWLIEEAYHIVGDLSETVSKLLPPPSHPMERNLTDWVEIINGFAAQTEEERKAAILAAWDALETNERFVFNKFITGGWRIGVSQQLVVKALGQHTGIDAQILAHRVMGNWEPANFTYEQLVQDEQEGASLGSRPYPFALAYQLDVPVENLGDVDDWQIEWKWDGIRAQIIRRDGEHFVWSRGEDLITDRFPEFKLLNEILPEGTVLDGEILCFSGDVPLPFNVLQTRIGRKNITPKILKEAPVKLVVYDLLELGGADLRQKPMAERRFLLERNLTEWDIPELLVPSPVVRPESWAAAAELRKEARARLTEGFMLKRRDSVYGVGRQKGRVVEMENRPANRGWGAGVCPKGHRQTRQPVYRLHLCGVERGRTGALCQSIQRAYR